MKIVMIGPYPKTPDYVFGGVESVISTLAPAMAEFPDVDHIHVLSYSNVSKITEVQVSSKLTIIHYPEQKRFKTITRSYFERNVITKLINKIKPDIVHGQGIGLMGHLAVSTFDNVVVSVHGVPQNEINNTPHKSITTSIKKILSQKMVDQVLYKSKIVISTTSYDFLSLKNKIRGNHIFIPNPVAPIYFSQDHHESSQPYFLHAGVMARRKNLEGILYAFSKLPLHSNFMLHIIGPQPDPAYKNEILKLIQSFKPIVRERIKLLGYLPNAAVIEQIRNCTALTMFSWEETRPTIISQAMASGKPIVSSNVGGISEMVENNLNGFLVTPGDTNNLALCLQRIAASSNLRHLMGKQSYLKASQEFDAKTIAHKTIEIYKTIL